MGRYQPFTLVDDKTFTYLFAHECMRVFHDKLIDDIDRKLVKKEESLSEISSVSEDIAIEMLGNLSIGEIDKEKVISLSRKVN